jgi:5'-3' exonuclease
MYDKPCGVDLLFSAYKALLPSMGGHITSGGSINRGRLVQLLVLLARDEEAAYKRRAVSTLDSLLCRCCRSSV